MIRRQVPPRRLHRAHSVADLGRVAQRAAAQRDGLIRESDLSDLIPGLDLGGGWAAQRGNGDVVVVSKLVGRDQRGSSVDGLVVGQPEGPVRWTIISESHQVYAEGDCANFSEGIRLVESAIDNGVLKNQPLYQRRLYHRKRQALWGGIPDTTRRVAGWDWDDHLNGYVAQGSSARFACVCGSEVSAPGYVDCQCGKRWNSSLISASGSTKLVLREVPVRADAVLANTRVASVGWEGLHADSSAPDIHDLEDLAAVMACRAIKYRADITREMREYGTSVSLAMDDKIMGHQMPPDITGKFIELVLGGVDDPGYIPIEMIDYERLRRARSVGPTMRWLLPELERARDRYS